MLAHISGDNGLIDTFKKNEDIHTRLLPRFSELILRMLHPMRKAKAVNFGIIYGMSDYGLSQDLKIPRKEAKIYRQLFCQISGSKQYMTDIVEAARTDGYVRTIMNRRRYIPETTSRNAVKRNFGERIAMNTPIQGSAADLIKIAMIKVHSELKRRNLNQADTAGA